MSTQGYLEMINNAAQKIKDADYILIGAGAGLSASGGLNYGDEKLFKKWYPELVKRGIRTIGEAISTYWRPNNSNRRAFWAYWVNHINNIRYNTPALKPYLDLLSIVSNKKYFVITTNVDGQFEKAGFSPENMFAPQGDYGLFQCSKPCSDHVYDNKSYIINMIANMDRNNFLIREQDIPKCPRCGAFMERNLRMDDTFVEAPHLLKQSDYVDFINSSVDGSLVLLELGVGFNTPVIIRYPFEQITSTHSKATLIRMNIDYPGVSPKIAEKCPGFSNDIMEVLSEIKAAM